MSQVKSGYCLPWQTPRPELTPWWYGGVGQHERMPVAMCTERPRRADKLPQKYGSGVPTMNSARTNQWGVGRAGCCNYDAIDTPEGTVKLPNETVESAQYMPTIATLTAVAHSADTRLAAPPSRYFK